MEVASPFAAVLAELGPRLRRVLGERGVAMAEHPVVPTTCGWKVIIEPIAEPQEYRTHARAAPRRSTADA